MKFGGRGLEEVVPPSSMNRKLFGKDVEIAVFGEEVAQVLSEIPDWQIFLGSCAMLTLLYFGGLVLLPNKSKNANRRRAWIITFFSSVVMSFSGLYFALRLYTTRGTILLPDPLDGSFSESPADSDVSKALCLFFLGYCLTDTFFCLVHYPDQVSIGLHHHTGYAVLLVYLMHSGKSLLFAVGAIEEFPTLILSMYELWGETRPRLATGLAIFALRLSYHLYVTYKAAEVMNTPLFFFSVYLLLHHIQWFRSWFFKRVEAVQAASNNLSASEAASAQKALKLEVTTHVYLVTLLMVSQTVMHTYLVFRELRETVEDNREWYERPWENGKLTVDMLGHALSFFFVTVRMVNILQDVYTEHFIMHTIEKRTIIYNISWEDPRVERELLQLGPKDVVLTISSAGCNVLDYLIEGPKAIVACDYNSAQLACLELKLACIKYGTYEEFWKIWAESCDTTFQRVYHGRGGLRDQILKSKTTTSKATVEFWDANQNIFKDNIMFAGSSGLAARLLLPGFRFIGLVDFMVKRKLYAPATASLALMRGFLQSQWVWQVMAPLGGVPKSQLDLVKRVPHIWAERLEEVIGRRMWLPDNYFYYAYIAGKWIKECCPRYMEEKHFAALKRNVTKNTVTLVHGGWADGAQMRNDFTLASLLDSMDWMPDDYIALNMSRLVPQMECGHKGKDIKNGVDNPAEPQKDLDGLPLQRLGTKKLGVTGNIFWRSFGVKVHSPVLASLRPELVPDDGRERVGWYLTQWNAEVLPNVDYSMLLEKGSGEVYKNTAMGEFKVIVAMAAHALRSEKDTVEFYKSQGKAYDGFREALLPDRDLLQHYCLPWHQKPKTWISVGCGTARDLEYVIGHVKACGTHVFLLDLSPALLQMALERVTKHGLENQITLVVADILKAYNSKGTVIKKNVKYLNKSKELPNLSECDLVTCSFCMTMIPPWKGCLEIMVKMLKTGGTLAIVDFTKREDRPDHWSQKLNGWWFANDGVYLNNEQSAAVKNHKSLKTIWYHETEARVPYTMLQATHYLYTGIKVD
jgi:ubiquinone/menaquinone biosynthesis C-methylase UbiE